ncbi:MAG TPA: hypothetical protein VLB44_05955 [Kofleriaceae bacterium]|nr:hypothetical protein [Kofleriaceae bacterium]
MTHTKLTITAFAFSLSALTACGVEPDLNSYEPAPSKLVYDHTTDGVKGSYQQNGVELRFHFARVADDATHVIFESGDGFILVDSLVGNGIESTSILGTYHVDGATTAVRIPSNALSDLEAMPEMQLVPALERDLLSHGIDLSELVSFDGSLGPILCPTAPTNPTNAAAKTAARE